MSLHADFSKLSVLMPVHNKARILRTVVHRVLHAPIRLPLEIVAVDDGSTDGSNAILKELASQDERLRVFHHEQPLGRAAALRRAIGEMTGDMALFQDADLGYSPTDFPTLLAPMLQGMADAVFGSRFASGSSRRVLSFRHSVASSMLTLICNLLNDLNLTEMGTGYKVIRADVLRAIPLHSNGLALESELTTKLAQWKLRLYEVPISYQTPGTVNDKLGFRATAAALWALLKYRFLSKSFTTHEGFYILNSVRSARGFNNWLVAQFSEFIGSRLLEAGCGIGNLSEHFLDRERLVCVDHDPFYLDRISHRFGHLDNIAVHGMDLTRSTDYDPLQAENLDTVICVNVLEHLRDDVQVLSDFWRVLRPGGHAIILVPAHPWLYTKVDRVLGHYRRYTNDELARKLVAAGFEVVHQAGFNRLGSLGWYVSGKILRKTTLTPGQMKTYERILPLAKLVERTPLLPHLSVIAIGRKPIAIANETRSTSDSPSELQSDSSESAHRKVKMHGISLNP